MMPLLPRALRFTACASSGARRFCFAALLVSTTQLSTATDNRTAQSSLPESSRRATTRTSRGAPPETTRVR